MEHYQYNDNPQDHTAVHPDVDRQKKTILIYSPDLNFCFSLSMLFQDRFNVITTTKVGMLETLVRDHGTDLLLVDAIPSEGMVERLRGLKELNRHMPIIMLYVYDGKNVPLETAVREHVDSVFYKPFDLADVSRRINELLPA